MRDLVGHRSGILTVKAPCCRISDGTKKKFWSCDCDCGKINHVVNQNNLISKRSTQSCGCKKGNPTHGAKEGKSGNIGRDLSWQSWRGAKERCLSSKHPSYQNYGGRGVKICDRWLGVNGFKNFVSDMGERPSKEYTLDRIDCNGDYEPENCRWATRIEQARNTRKNKFWEYQGQTFCETELTQMLGINLRTFRHRIDLGWSFEEAIKVIPYTQSPGICVVCQSKLGNTNRSGYCAKHSDLRPDRRNRRSKKLSIVP